MNSRKIRVGAVNYLNTKPLICDLRAFAPKVELSSTCPAGSPTSWPTANSTSRLIPVIEYFRAGGYSIVPDIAIASRGPVLSVTLFSRVPWEQIRPVALDEGSRTSAALDADPAEAALSRRMRSRSSLPLDADPEDLDADAVLLIGDRAMRACLPGFRHAFDLGPGMVRLDGLAVRLCGLGGARRASIWAASTWALAEAKRHGWRGRA